MRHLVLVSVLALAACSKAPDSGSAGGGSAQPEAISPTSAPGVAFAYDYSFRLADDRIKGVQDAHATACEALGPTRCRITGNRYSKEDSGRINGMLSFALEPTIARRFGNDAIAVVERNEGTLAAAETTGTDAGGAIAQADTSTRDIRAELAAVEARARTATGGEREALVRQAEELRTQLTSVAATRTDARASLALTPMTFNYRSGDLVGGLDLRDAVGTASASFNAMVWFIIVALGALLPWAVLAGAIYAAFRFVRGLFRRRRPLADKGPEKAVVSAPTPEAAPPLA